MERQLDLSSKDPLSSRCPTLQLRETSRASYLRLGFFIKLVPVYCAVYDKVTNRQVYGTADYICQIVSSTCEQRVPKKTDSGRIGW